MEFRNGPNQIVPCDHFTTADPDGRVSLRIPEAGKAIETTPPISVPGLLIRTAQEFPNHPALAHKKDGKWIKISYTEYLDQVRTTAKAFLKLGLQRYHAVGILGFNSPEWLLSNLGAIFAGGFGMGIYTTNSSEACHYCLEHSRANIVVVQDQKQLDKILEVKSRLPDLKAIIQYEGVSTVPGVLSWNDVMKIGQDSSDDALDEVLKTMVINECCTLVYTSGTVGHPKGVMLSHDNLTWDALAISERLDITKGEEHLVSYLPLSHVAAQIVDIYLSITNAACTYFADKNALKGSLLGCMQEVQPTKFIAVPRVWEKMAERMQEMSAKNSSFKQSLFEWAKNQALQNHAKRIKGVSSSSWGFCIANSLIFKRVKAGLGLLRCNALVSAAAPLAPEVKRFFLSLDLQIQEAFGMSEVGGAHTLCNLNCYALDSIGMSLPGMLTRIDKPEDGHGEICLKGRHVFMGYLKDPEKINEAFDSDGWLHTGDIGRLDDKNYVYITGRLKELIITAGGENVAPVPIEQLVKAELPHVSSAFLVGDKMKFLSILLSLKTEVDPELRPLDTLLPSVQDWLAELGCPATTVSEVLEAGPDPKLLKALQEGIDKVNLQAVSNAQKIQKLAILPADFSLPTGELGPTMKVKRNVVTAKYQSLIEKLYV